MPPRVSEVRSAAMRSSMNRLFIVITEDGGMIKPPLSRTIYLPDEIEGCSEPELGVLLQFNDFGRGSTIRHGDEATSDGEFQ
jgi:hypothetical protein